MLKKGQRGENSVGDGVGTHFDLEYVVWSAERLLMKRVSKMQKKSYRRRRIGTNESKLICATARVDTKEKEEKTRQVN